ELWLNASAEDIDAFDVLKYSWFDNGEPLGEGKSIKVKLRPGRHTISLEVSDGTEKVLAEVSVVVVKAEKVTVQDSGFVAGAGLALALVLVLVVVAAVVTVMSRRKRRPEAEAARAGAGMAAAAAAARPPEKDEVLDDARKLVAEVEDALAEHLEKHPEGAAQVSAAMEKLDLARDFIKEGDGEAAMQFAIEAKGALGAAGSAGAVKGEGGMEAPAAAAGGAAAPAVAKKKLKKAGGLRCPSCGEALEPDWPVCPACGHRTR
ncbi:MAG: zinc ribbon domain-containing protein, partial [Thermoplasmata archaeon]